MPFGLKNAGATYMRAMTTIFQDMIHKENEVVRGRRHNQIPREFGSFDTPEKILRAFASVELEVKSRQMHFWSPSWEVVRVYSQQKRY